MPSSGWACLRRSRRAEYGQFAGPASPVVLNGYADRILECIYRSDAGNVLVLDNNGRSDEACFGDLAAYEALSQGLVGVVIWAGIVIVRRSRRSVFPCSHTERTRWVCSGRSRPSRNLSRAASSMKRTIERGDFVFADDDGVLFVPKDHIESVMDTAEEIQRAEQAQVEKIRAGTTLREQLQFDRYLREKKNDPTLTLGEHMKKIGRHF